MPRLRPEVTGPPAVLGIDLGTSQVKARLCAERAYQEFRSARA